MRCAEYHSTIRRLSAALISGQPTSPLIRAMLIIATTSNPLQSRMSRLQTIAESAKLNGSPPTYSKHIKAYVNQKLCEIADTHSHTLTRHEAIVTHANISPETRTMFVHYESYTKSLSMQDRPIGGIYVGWYNFGDGDGPFLSLPLDICGWFNVEHIVWRWIENGWLCCWFDLNMSLHMSRHTDKLNRKSEKLLIKWCQQEFECGNKVQTISQKKKKHSIQIMQFQIRFKTKCVLVSRCWYIGCPGIRG